MSKQTTGFIPPHGGYQKLLTYQKALIIYEGTLRFTEKHFTKYDRTIDQMVQAARSGKQNIIEASMASATSKETEIKLTNVARASLEELIEDYRDFLIRIRKCEWSRSNPASLRFSEINRTREATYETFKPALEHADAEISANSFICLINITTYLLKKQLEALEREFLQSGGLRERMFQARLSARNNQKF